MSLGVADGVGGWRNYGVDPSDFSYSLLRSIDHLITREWSPCHPVELLSAAFRELVYSKRPITGLSFMLHYPLFRKVIAHTWKLSRK